MTVLRVTSRSLYHSHCKLYIFTRIMLAISIVSLTYIVIQSSLFNLSTSSSIVGTNVRTHSIHTSVHMNTQLPISSDISSDINENNNNNNLDTNIVIEGKLTSSQSVSSSSSSSSLSTNNATKSTRINGQVNTLRKHSCKWPSLTVCFDADTHTHTLTHLLTLW